MEPGRLTCVAGEALMSGQHCLRGWWEPWGLPPAVPPRRVTNVEASKAEGKQRPLVAVIRSGDSPQLQSWQQAPLAAPEAAESQAPVAGRAAEPHQMAFHSPEQNSPSSSHNGWV